MDKNKKAPARQKAEENYILTTKLFCGKCGKFMFGESGTSANGVIYRYYKCAGAKKKKSCNKKAIPKGLIEDYVIQQTINTVLQDDVIEKIADSVMNLNKRENVIVAALKNRLKDVKKSINNLVGAIEQGIITSTTKSRLMTLESEKEDIEISIMKEEMQETLLTKEQVIFWISRFKDGDINDIKYREQLIDIFVNAVFLYDDKIVITYNYKDGTKTVSLKDIESSDLFVFSQPRKSRKPCGFPAFLFYTANHKTL